MTNKFAIEPFAHIPSKITLPSVMVYLGMLALCAFLYAQYSMNWYWWVIGIVEVAGFFFFANYLSKEWIYYSPKSFEKNLFWWGWLLRVGYMSFLYWFFNMMTGQPFMFSAADAIGYHEEALWIAETIREGHFQTYLDYKFAPGNGVSDAGYPMYLGFVYFLFGDSIVIARLLKCLWSALTCVLLYQLAKRNFGEYVGRMAGIMMMLWPHFLVYSGMHLKETEMVFMMVLFLERADALLRYRNFSFKNIAIVIVLMASLFTFRTILGLCGVMSVTMALLLSSKRLMSWSKRVVFLVLFAVVALFFIGGRITSEIEHYWSLKDENQSSRWTEIVQTQSLAKYASAPVMASMIFTFPFPTMVDTEGQENSRLIHGGLVVKNILSYFCIAALFLLVISKAPNGETWRHHVLIGAFLIGYLVILIFSAFIHADRFHMPALPLEIIFIAYGISIMRQMPWIKRYFTFWSILMLVACIVWNWFKLSGRGLI